jgi:hypothetical protein
MEFAFELQSTINADPIFQFTGKPKRNTGGHNSGNIYSLRGMLIGTIARCRAGDGNK